MKDVLPEASLRRVCVLLEVSRSVVQEPVVQARPVVLDEVLVERVRRVIDEHPTFGYRRIWAILRFGQKVVVNRKAV